MERIPVTQWGVCPYCQTSYRANANEIPGCNEREALYCPVCRKDTGDTLRCGDIPQVVLHDDGKLGMTQGVSSVLKTLLK